MNTVVNHLMSRAIEGTAMARMVMVFAKLENQRLRIPSGNDTTILIDNGSLISISAAAVWTDSHAVTKAK